MGTRVLAVMAVLPAIIAAGAAGPPPARAAMIFAVECEASHRSLDDPIVAPGMPGAAHYHEFTGAWSTDAFSTFESLQRSGTTCLTGAADREDATADTSAYWAPALYQHGERVPLGSMTIYVSPGPNNNTDQLRQLRRWPDGLRFIMDMRVGASGGVEGWNCGGNFLSEIPSQDTPPDCTQVGGKIQAHIASPTCWDGVNLDSSDHRSHMAYTPAGTSGCPESHPVIVPEMSIKHSYDHRGAGGGFTIAGGKGVEDKHPSMFHADFFNAWDADRLNQLVDFCIKQGGAESNTRPCLHPNGPYDEIVERKSWIANPNSPDPTPAPAAPGPAPGPDNGPVWSHGPVTLTGEQHVVIPDLLGADDTYTLTTRYTVTGDADADKTMLMIGNADSDHARLYVNGTKVRGVVVNGGQSTSLASRRVQAGSTHDFALVRDGDTVRYHVNGELVATASAPPATDLGPGVLGAYRAADDGFYAHANGEYAGAQIYPYALTAQQLTHTTPDPEP